MSDACEECAGAATLGCPCGNAPVPDPRTGMDALDDALRYIEGTRPEVEDYACSASIILAAEVRRLREWYTENNVKLCEAERREADLLAGIDRLRAENERLRGALSVIAGVQHSCLTTAKEFREFAFARLTPAERLSLELVSPTEVDVALEFAEGRRGPMGDDDSTDYYGILAREIRRLRALTGYGLGSPLAPERTKREGERRAPPAPRPMTEDEVCLNSQCPYFDRFLTQNCSAATVGGEGPYTEFCREWDMPRPAPDATALREALYQGIYGVLATPLRDASGEPEVER